MKLNVKLMLNVNRMLSLRGFYFILFMTREYMYDFTWLAELTSNDPWMDLKTVVVCAQTRTSVR